MNYFSPVLKTSWVSLIIGMLWVGGIKDGAWAGPIQPPAPTDAWFFDEGTGGEGTIVKPRWGNNPGTLYSKVSWTTDTPFVYEGNSALWFDGTKDNRVNFGPHTFGTAGSISIWAYRLPGAQYLFDASPGGRTLLYSTFTLFLNDTLIGSISNLLDDNRWTHLVITWDNSDPTEKQKIYKNGQLWATFNTTLSEKTPAMLWLGNRYSNNERWVGGIDEYALWNQALTPEEIAWLFQHSLREIPEPSTLALLAAGAVGLPVLVRGLRRRKAVKPFSPGSGFRKQPSVEESPQKGEALLTLPNNL